MTGRAVPAPTVTAGVDPTALRGTDGGDDDRLSAAVLRDLEGWWATEFPPLAGGRAFVAPAAYSLDGEVAGPVPPCIEEARDAEGNAFYCPRPDALGIDRAALIPVLRAEFGDAAVVVVLAHEFGHAVARRLADGAPGPGPRLPTIVEEAQADCYGAAFTRAVRDGRTPDLRTGDAGVDGALATLVAFRDPVETGQDDVDAHGNAYDRITSFQLGFEGGPAVCAGITPATRTFTQRPFSTDAEEASRGNLPLADLVGEVGPGLGRFFADVVRARGAGAWTAPAARLDAGPCPGAGGVPEPVRWCAGDGTLRVDGGPALAEDVHRRIGDYATVTLLASRDALAALAALGRPTTGAAAGRAAVCLAGAYTTAAGTPGSGVALSPGDLDEAVGLLLRSDGAARATDGAVGATSGYERVRAFRAGVDGGADACLA